MDETLTQCIDCEQALPDSSFYNRSKHRLCKTCSKARAKRRYHACEETRTGTKLRNRKKLCERYGITWEQFGAMFDRQGGGCAICDKPLALFVPHRDAHSACIDHCHTTKQVRGVLCRSCNVGIGGLQDSPALMARAAQYVSGTLVDHTDILTEIHNG